MGDLEKTVKILFQGDDQVSQTINSLSGTLGSFESIVGSVADPFADIADGVIKADAALSAMAVGGLAYAFTKAMQFESAAVELNKVLGDETPESLAIAQDAAIDLSNQYGQSASDILNSTANFKQAGYDVEEAMQLAKNAMDLVIVGGVDASEASALLVSTLKGFGSPASEANRLLDILNETSNNYATNVEELATGMADLSPIASQMGFSFEETAGILTPVIEVFRSGDEVSRAFRTGLLNLTSDTPRVTQALAELGISQTDVNGQMKSGRDIFYEVQAVFQNLTDTEKTYYAQQLVGKDQAAKMALAFSSMNKTLEVTETAMGAAGSAAKELESYFGSAEHAVDVLKARLENLATLIGTEFENASKNVINGGNSIVLALQQMVKDGTFDEIFEKINEFGNQLGADLKAIAKNLPEAFEGIEFKDLIDSFENLEDSVRGLFSDVDLTTSEGLKEALQGVLNTISSLLNTTAGMVDGFKPFWESIKGSISSFNELKTETQEAAGQILALSKAVVEFGPKFTAIILAMSESADNLAPVFNVVINTISGALETMKLGWNTLKLAFLEIVEDLMLAGNTFSKTFMFGAFSDDIEENITKVQSWKTETKKAMYDAASAATEKLTGMKVNFTELNDTAAESVEKIEAIPKKLDKIPEKKESKIEMTGIDGLNSDLNSINGTLADIPDEKKVDVFANVSMGDLGTLYNGLQDLPEEKQILVQSLIDAGELKAAISMLEEIPGEKIVDIAVKTDPIEEAKKAWQTLEVELEDGTTVSYTVEADMTSATKATKDIQETLEPAKTLEIQTELDKAKLETIENMFGNLTDTMNTAIEWDAKLNIASLEAETEQVKATMESLGVAIEATSDTVSTMFSSLSEGGGAHFYELYDLLEKEINMQESLVAAETRLANAQAARIESGEPIGIQVESSALAPALEMIFQEIMEMAQVTANAEGLSLLGVGD